jgi:phage shock protein A
LEKANGTSAFAQFTRLEDRAERAEAMSDAYDRLDGRDPDSEEIERKFAADERRDKVSSELASLRARVKEDN